ncbi:MAG: hypothetical protein M3Y48_14585 [Actinomycetota bacterium]|nr:hypothetical protein [Actinomycetota bacterium]
MTQRTAAEPEVPQQESEETFDRLVDEGEQRLGRSWLGLAATGFLGGWGRHLAERHQND